jgi:hypothetical protein
MNGGKVALMPFAEAIPPVVGNRNYFSKFGRGDYP